MLIGALSRDALLALCVVLCLVSIIVTLSAIGARRETRFAVQLARERAGRIGDLLHTARTVESIAELGIWQFDPATGNQEWSDGMQALFGVGPDERFVEGDAETLLFANDVDLIGQVLVREHETEPYTLHYNIHGFDGLHRSMSVQAYNLRDSGSKVLRVVAVVRDVTDQVERERELEQSRAYAVREARKARELAETDALTELANRRRVMSELDRLVVRAREQHQSLSVIVFDIDHFKSVNDTYGHPEGDRVLKQIAAIAMRQAREGDVVGRVGGEEFVWLVPGANGGQARILAERLRIAVSSGSSVGAMSPVTVSIGFTSLIPGDASLSLFARADAALYEAKHAGRNRVRMAA
ncbi:MAG: GGDEF domain-containing protein [Erythrobacter sp.]